MARSGRRIDPVASIVISGLVGGAAGLAIWMLTETFVFLPVFLAASLVGGIAIAQSLRRR